MNGLAWPLAVVVCCGLAFVLLWRFMSSLAANKYVDNKVAELEKKLITREGAEIIIGNVNNVVEAQKKLDIKVEELRLRIAFQPPRAL